MIPLREFKTIALALPRCSITEPNGNVSWILDKDDERIGSIHWKDARITIFQEYEFCEEVIEAIGKNQFTECERHFDPDDDLPITLPDDPFMNGDSKEYTRKLIQKNTQKT